MAFSPIWENHETAYHLSDSPLNLALGLRHLSSGNQTLVIFPEILVG